MHIATDGTTFVDEILANDQYRLAKMNTLFCVRPATRNIGNDIINKATIDLIFKTMGDDVNVVNIPALKGPQHGGITARQVYDANRFADGMIIGGGNLFENGQLTIEPQALDALCTPLFLIGLSHGRVHGRYGHLMDRSDAMPAAGIRQLISKSQITLVRDHASQALLKALNCENVQVGGCPTLFLESNSVSHTDNGRILLSVRHPSRMNVPINLQWRVAEDLRRLIAALQKDFGDNVILVCHDYADLEFAAGFPSAPYIYFDNVNRYIEALRNARLSVSYRLHAFLPCVAFGTPSVHLSYDERGKEMVATAGMSDWDVDIANRPDFLDAVMDRLNNINKFFAARRNAMPIIEELKNITMKAMGRFTEDVRHYAGRANEH